MPQNPPPGIQRLTPRLAYDDPQAAINFLETAFGFPERAESRLEGPNGSIIVAEVQIGDAYLMIGRSGAHGMASPRQTGAPTLNLIVYVDDIDQHHEQARAAGAVIVSELADQYWGDRRYEAQDCEGHLWSFHERTREVPQDEIDAVEATFKQQ